jgi:hypothetical protein
MKWIKLYESFDPVINITQISDILTSLGDENDLIMIDNVWSIFPRDSGLEFRRNVKLIIDFETPRDSGHLKNLSSIYTDLYKSVESIENLGGFVLERSSISKNNMIICIEIESNQLPEIYNFLSTHKHGYSIGIGDGLSITRGSSPKVDDWGNFFFIVSSKFLDIENEITDYFNSKGWDFEFVNSVSNNNQYHYKFSGKL